MDEHIHPHIQIVIGSVREGRASGPVARWVAWRFEDEFGYPAEVVDLRFWALPDFDLSMPPAMGKYPSRLQRAWAASVSRADAFIFVVPEYNHGYPAVLKNAFDWVYAEWAGKPAAFVSFGNANGARSVQQVKQVMGELRMVPVEPLVALRPHRQIEARTFAGTEEDERHLSRALSELLRWETALRTLRQEQPVAPWSGKRVLVVGLDPSTNRSVVAPLRAAGLEAVGHVHHEGDPVPNGEGFDLVAIGRGAAGPIAHAVRASVAESSPDTPVIDVIGPLAVRQILSALDPSAPRLKIERADMTAGKLSLVVSGDEGLVTVTALDKAASGIVPRKLASIALNRQVSVDLFLASQPYSLMVDLDGNAFQEIECG